MLRSQLDSLLHSRGAQTCCVPQMETNIPIMPNLTVFRVYTKSHTFKYPAVV